MAVPYGQEPFSIRKVQKQGGGLDMKQPKIQKITATIWNDGEPKQHEVRGKPARTLCALVKAAGRGVTGLRAIKHMGVASIGVYSRFKA